MTDTGKIKTARVSPENTIAFQGLPGAYSDLACRQVHPDMTPRPCQTFEEAFDAVEGGAARFAMIPIDNSVAGRVADIHQLMPHARLHIVAEHFQPVNHHLLAPRGATMDSLVHVHSHVHALSQCRKFLHDHGLKPVVHADTAGAAQDVAAKGDPREAAIASELAAETYGLQSLAAGIEDAAHNTTRFVVLARRPLDPDLLAGKPAMTTFVFEVKNVPAALYKALGGFATNRVNITKLESYMVDQRFTVAQFYAEFEGHPADPAVANAFDELQFFCERLKRIGTYPKSPYRDTE